MARRINNMYGPGPAAAPQPGLTPQAGPSGVTHPLQPPPSTTQVQFPNQQSPFTAQSGDPGAAMQAARRALVASSGQGGSTMVQGPSGYRGPGDQGPRMMRGPAPQSPAVPWEASSVSFPPGGGQMRPNAPNQMMARVQSFPNARAMGPSAVGQDDRQRKLYQITQKLKMAKTKEEQAMIIAELKHDTELLAQVLNLTKQIPRNAPVRNPQNQGGGPAGPYFGNRASVTMNQNQARPPGQYFDQRMGVPGRFPVSQPQQFGAQQASQPPQGYQHGQMNFGNAQGQPMGQHPLNQVRSPPTGGVQVRSPLPGSNQYMAGGMMGPDGGQPPNPSPQAPVMYSTSR